MRLKHPELSLADLELAREGQRVRSRGGAGVRDGRLVKLLRGALPDGRDGVTAWVQWEGENGPRLYMMPVRGQHA